jgi:hypothetical protein
MRSGARMNTGPGTIDVMSRPRPKTASNARTDRPFGFFREIDMFFEGKDPVHQTMRRLVRRLERAGIPHAIVGGMAVYAHGYRRTTDDVDVLLTRDGLKAFVERFVPKNYVNVPGRSRRFIDRVNKQSFDVLVTGMYPGSGRPGPISYPDPVDVQERIKNVYYIDLQTLVQLKLAARRHQDFADVVELIRVHDLDESFVDRLHSSLHRDFNECLEEKRREDEYEARND